MAVSFFNYLDQKRVNRRIDSAADLILKTGFPIEQFHDWYCEVGIYLRPEQVMLEDFWRDTATGALAGAGIGGVAGGAPGAFVGGAMGGFMGGAKAAGRGIHRWLNPNGYRISAFKRNKEQVVSLLHQMKLLSDEMNNNTNYAKGSSGGKNIENPNFAKLMNAVISYLSVMEDPKLVGANSKPTSQSPSPAPAPAPASPSPAPSTAPKDEAEVAATTEFQTAIGEIASFATGIGIKLDAAYQKFMAKEIATWLGKGAKWPEVLESFKKTIMFTDTDPGYGIVLNALKTDAKYKGLPNPDVVAKRFYFDAMNDSFGKGLDPKALAAEALRLLDDAMKQP